MPKKNRDALTRPTPKAPKGLTNTPPLPRGGGINRPGLGK